MLFGSGIELGIGIEAQPFKDKIVMIRKMTGLTPCGSMEVILGLFFNFIYSPIDFYYFA